MSTGSSWTAAGTIGIAAMGIGLGLAMNFLTADHYMAIVIPGQMYAPVYKKINLHPKNLSRVLEDAGTLTSPSVPWSTCGAVYMATLGIGALQYGKYYFLGILVPII